MFPNAKQLFKGLFVCRLFLLLILLWNVFLVGEAVHLDPMRLSNELKRVQDQVLGVRKLQDFFNSLSVDHEPVDGSKLVDKLSKQLKQRFNEKIEVVNKIRKAVEDAYLKETVTTKSSFPECCKVEPTKNDYRFHTKVDVDNMCFTRASNANPDAKYLPKSILETMKRNLKEKPNTKWQYFGSQDGLFYDYPANKFSDCSSYDPRIQPWYVHGIAPEGKDVVIILDKSDSMTAKHGGKTLMEIAVDATSTVLESLSPKDRVGIVAFSTDVETPGSPSTSECYDTELAQAVPVNIKYLKQYLGNIRAKGSTFYSLALRKAFDLLKSSGERNDTLTKRRKVILFLTDGQPTEPNTQEILNILKEEKASLKNITSKEVVIFAYGIGNYEYSLLKKIADDTEAEGTKGRFTAIQEKDIDQLRSVFSSFYDLFATSANEKHRSHSLSFPHYDVRTLGPMVAVVVPYRYKGNVIGVAGTDVPFSDLISDVFYFSKGEHSYAFLIERETGNAVIHPHMPILQSPKDDSVVLHITSLEQAPEFKTVLKSMMRGEEGQTSFTSKRFFPVRLGTDAGVRELSLRSTYYWKAVEGTNLAVCVVLAGNGTDTVLKIDDYVNKPVIYHREIDLVEGKNFSECSHYGTRATNDRPVVKFSPQSFERPFDYLTMTETEDTIKAFKDYIQHGDPNPEPEFKLGIREMMVPALKAEEIWDTENSFAKNYLSYFTYATTNGIMYFKPGTFVGRSYDPSRRPWFQQALNNKGKLTLTAPYLDGLGSGVLIDMVHSLQAKSSGVTPDHDDVLAVLDASFGIFQFYRLLTENYPECSKSNHRCFVMDQSGFLIVHKSFVDFETLSNLEEFPQKISSLHITVEEKGIAEDLIERNILRRKQCKNYKEIAVENFYEVHLNGTAQSTSACLTYEVSQLEGTNAYLGIVEDSKCLNEGACTCPSLIYKATENECVCPFKSKIDYKYCKNEFPANNLPLCPVSPELLTSIDPPADSEKNLPDCNQGDCKQSNSESCFREKTCNWCEYDKETQRNLENPFCASKEVCYGGVKGNRLSSLYEEKELVDPDESTEKKPNVYLISGTGAASVIIIIFITLVIVFKLCRRKKGEEKKDIENQHAQPPQTKSPVKEHRVERDRQPEPEPGYEVPYVSHSYIEVNPHYEEPYLVGIDKSIAA